MAAQEPEGTTTGSAPAKVLTVWRTTLRDAAQSPPLNAGWPQQVCPSGKRTSQPRCSSTSTVAAADVVVERVAEAGRHQLDAPADDRRAAREGHHQIVTRSAAGRRIGAPSGTSKAAANSSRLESGPLHAELRRASAGRSSPAAAAPRAGSFSRQMVAKLRKKRCSGVKPSILSRGLPASAFCRAA